MGGLSYRDTIYLTHVGISSELNAVLSGMGCITVGDVMHRKLVEFVVNKEMAKVWDEFNRFLLHVFVSRGLNFHKQ